MTTELGFVRPELLMFERRVGSRDPVLSLGCPSTLDRIERSNDDIYFEEGKFGVACRR